jgi:hypothetical protein
MKPAIALFADIGEPTIPAPAQSGLDLGSRGDLFNPKGIVQHLNINAQFIHVSKSKLDVVQLPCALRRSNVSTRSLRKLRDLLFG